MTITAACDGSALGNPGPAGWAWYIDDDTWAAGGWPESTNNRGELQAVLELLLATAHRDEDLKVLCDSKYVINAITKWMPTWRVKGWKKANGQDVLNRDQMELLHAAVTGRKVKFEWVKGHNDHPLNEAADSRARAAAEAYRRGTAVPTGPGFPGDPRGAEGAEDAAGPEDGTAEAPRAPETTSPTAAAVADRVEESAPATEFITVSCPLEKPAADEIVRRARTAGVTAQQELADLIARGMREKYGVQS